MADSIKQPFTKPAAALDLTTEDHTATAASVAGNAAASKPAGAVAIASTGARLAGAHQQVAASEPVSQINRTGSANLPQTTAALLGSPAPSAPASVAQPTPDREPEPAKIISDILPPSLPPPPTPASNVPSMPLISTPRPAGAGKSKSGSKYATDERRRATSIALRERWASGAMDNVHKKRLETMRKRKEAAALLGTPGVSKPSGPLDKASKSPNQARKPSLVSERLARLLGDSLWNLGREAGSSGSQRPTSAPSTTASSDIEMADPEITGSETVSGLDTGNVSDSDGAGDGNGEWEPLEMAAPGRPYTKWKYRDGPSIPTCGVLIPEGYQLSTTTPGHPWICPIRSCRKVFAMIRHLGNHFVRGHRGVLLHDNEDGTLSERGKYALNRRGKSSGTSGAAQPPKPAIIVSRGPADPSAPPPLPPSYPSSSSASMTSGGEEPVGTIEPKSDESQDNARALWAYIRPHLVKHTSPDPPAMGWVRELLTVPRVREIDWNTPWLAAHPFTDSMPRDISALIIQVTGDPAPEPCERCKSGRGPFKSCIMISANAPNGPQQAIISCGNCFYHFGQTYCTNKALGYERARQAIRASLTEAKPAELDQSSDSSEAELETESDSDAGIFVTPDAVKDEDDVGGADDSTAATSLTHNNVSTAITEAEPGRPYTMWPDEQGVLAPIYGALLPAGYRLDTTNRSRPWVCPVRTCRKPFLKKLDLGFHFSRVHYAAQLHDNGDGTFSVKGVYKPRGANMTASGKILSPAPPIVVSRESVGGSKDSKDSKDPSQGPHPPAYSSSKSAQRSSEEPAATRTGTQEALGKAGDLWNYIRPFLQNTTEIPKGGAIKELLTLPQRRQLVMNPSWGKFRESESRDIAAMLIQVTGEEVPGACNRCREGRGPFKGCVVAAKSTHPAVKARYPCCGNCVYQGKKFHCSLTANPNSSTVRQQLGHSATSEENVGAAGGPDRGSAPRTQVSSSTSSVNPRASSLILPGALQGPGDLLEMEDWEVAPGRIRETANAAGVGAETIAFSKAYLTTSLAVPVCDDVSFRVDTIYSGNTLQLEADPDRTRLCSVAAGKVRVSIGSEPEFVVGPHGMFKVKAGAACRIRNVLYLDAVLHTTILQGFI